jgi:hypothetical protein
MRARGCTHLADCFQRRVVVRCPGATKCEMREMLRGYLKGLERLGVRRENGEER